MNAEKFKGDNKENLEYINKPIIQNSNNITYFTTNNKYSNVQIYIKKLTHTHTN